MQSSSLCVEEVMAWTVSLGSAHDMNLPKDEHALGLFSPGFSPRSQDLSRGKLKRQHQSMLSRHDEADEDELGDELGNPAEKKRRLTIDQVKFLEMSFNKDLKLEPERKALIAKQLGLRPRQVAIWFQNRRARWKNKQLEQDYETLKDKYEAAVKENENILKENEAVREDNRRLQAEVDRLSSLLQCSDNQANCNVMDGNATLGKSSTASNSESGLKEEQSSGKSGLTSPTKSSDDQSEVQDSGRSYPTLEEGAFNAPELSLIELDSGFLYSGLKLESEYPTLSSDELFGNLINPRLLQQLAVNGVYFEDAYNVQISWEDQIHGYSW